MSDLLKAIDLGVCFHVTTNHSFLNNDDVIALSKEDILTKISSFPWDIAERDFELAYSKPLLPKNFQIKPYDTQPVKQKTVAENTKNTKQKFDTNTDGIASELDKKILEATLSAEQATDILSLKSIINNFDFGLKSKDFSLQTLIYDDTEDIDVLWINDAVSDDDDKNHKIMSDIAGQMIINLFKNLGYERNKETAELKIGCTALSFWSVPPDIYEQKPEYKICLPFLKKLIYLLKPKKIILSGSAILKYLTGNDDVLKHHGQKFSVSIFDKNFDCYCVFGISYILRSEVTKKIFWFDLLKILQDNSKTQ